MLIGLAQRGIRPDLILFADVDGEKPETYLYAPIIRQWLRDVDFPQFEVVRYRPILAPYDTLFGNCWHNETLPSLALGRKSWETICHLEGTNKPPTPLQGVPPEPKQFDGKPLTAELRHTDAFQRFLQRRGAARSLHVPDLH